MWYNRDGGPAVKVEFHVRTRHNLRSFKPGDVVEVFENVARYWEKRGIASRTGNPVTRIPPKPVSKKINTYNQAILSGP